MTSRDAFLALNLLPKIGPIRLQRLLAHFQSPLTILSASPDQLRQVEGIGSDTAEAITSWESLIDLEEEKRRMADHGIRVVTLEDDDYPQSLREIYDPPSLLYVRGELLPRDSTAVGVVGSRRMTHYGQEQARKLSFQLARSGFTIISGLARGIDTAAHEAALAAGGRTIAVLGSGIGHLYPPENAELASRIAESGAVISEFPVLYVPDKQSFPLRNRIVSGLSKGLLVVEAPVRSGSLITANQALDQGRSVFAVPGPINRPTSEGCHRLIQQGAKLVCSANDVIDDLDSEISRLNLEFDAEAPSDENEREASLFSETETKILGQLESDELTIDTLSERTKLPPSAVSASLLQLEMKRAVKQLPGKYFTKLI